MIKEKNKNNMLIIILILLFALILCVIVGTSTTIAFADSETLDLDDVDKAIMKYKRAASIDEDFEKERLKVIIKHKYSVTYNEKTALEQIQKDVQNIQFESIEGWISIEEIKRNPLWNEDSFHQILYVYLNPSKLGKENVLLAVDEFSKSEIVLSALPFYNYKAIDAWEPNDPSYGNQWGLNGSKGIKAESAWNIERGNNAVRVGLFETGAQKNHEDLNGLFLQENFTMGATQHGTLVAGIIGATSNNGIGISGIADVQLLLLDQSNFKNSLEHAANNNVWIINASYHYEYGDGSYAPYDTEHVAAINRYAGLLICSAGNDGINTDNSPCYPAGYSNLDNVISVGSMNEDGTCRTLSNFGANSVSLFAPGGLIYSTLPTNTYGYVSGTSFAAPHVTGTAALMLSYMQTKPHDMTTKEISAQIKSAILDNVTTSSSLSGLCVSGGYLNAYYALDNLPFTKEQFNGFGYNGSTYYWNGKVDMTVAQATDCYVNSSNTMVFTGYNMTLDFLLSTASTNNGWSKIEGTVSFQLKNSSGEIVQIEENDTHVSTVKVDIWDNVTLGNKTFRIAPALLPNDTYTLTLTSVMKRDLGQIQTQKHLLSLWTSRFFVLQKVH